MKSDAQPWDGPEAEVLATWYLVGNTYEGRSDSWFASRVVVQPETAEVSTVLRELAKVKYPALDLSKLQPYWLDANMLNEKLENVGLSVKGASADRVETRGRKAGNKYGAMAGTPEYHKAYREQNKEKVNEIQKRYQKRVRALARAAKEQGVSTTAVPAAPPSPLIEDLAHGTEQEQRLARILALTGEEKDGNDSTDTNSAHRSSPVE